LRRVTEVITQKKTQWVVEADIKGFFDHVSHKHLKRFLEHRISDRRFLRIITRFLKAGVLEDGVFSASEEGTPQGGLVSPVLSNIYLHYVLDLWFEKRYRRSCRGEAHLVRFADDFVACFEDEADARRFIEALKERLAAFDLEVEPTKTAVLRFGNQAERDSHRDGLRRPRTFNFLGITHFVGRTRKGNFAVGHKTERKRFSQKLKRLDEMLKQLRLDGGKAMMSYVQQHLRGHIQYYGVSGNIRSLRRYYYVCCRLLFKWLNRRATCAYCAQSLSHTLVEDSDWEPDGLTDQVRFCEGPVTTGARLRSCGTAGQPGGNGENKHQPATSGGAGLLSTLHSALLPLKPNT